MVILRSIPGWTVCWLFLYGSACPAFAQSVPDPLQNRPAKSSYLIPSVEIVGINLGLNRFSRAFIDREAFTVGWSSIRQNLKSRWVIDPDDFQTNQFQHAYQGTLYHTAARSSGNNFWKSAAFTAAGSALWEIAGETVPPSKNDQIVTTVGGALLGESLFRMASMVLEKANGSPTFWRGMAATGIAPATGLNRALFGNRFDGAYRNGESDDFLQWTLGGITTKDRFGGIPASSRTSEVFTAVSVVRGLPGRSEMTYSRPFDYFSFEAATSTARPVEALLTRGLLTGTTYEVGSSYRGVWGLYGSYDYLGPNVGRVSSVALSVGTNGQWRFPKSVTLQGSAMAGGGYGAGGETGGPDRPYHYGFTPQALLSLRFIFGNTMTFDLTGRGYQVTRFLSTHRQGLERIGHANASLTMRLSGRQGVTMRYLLARRFARFPLSGVHDDRSSSFSLAYTIVVGDRFGAVDW